MRFFRRPLALPIEVFDRHAEHVDPTVPLCEHGKVTLLPGDSLDISDGTHDGAVIRLELRFDGTLQVEANTDTYFRAKAERMAAGGA